jgi:hypothetical protein
MNIKHYIQVCSIIILYLRLSFLYPGASYKAFKLENGLDDVKKYIGSIPDIYVSIFSMPHSLRIPNKIKVTTDKLNNQSEKIIMEIYKLDFDKSNY